MIGGDRFGGGSSDVCRFDWVCFLFLGGECFILDYSIDNEREVLLDKHKSIYLDVNCENTNHLAFKCFEEF